MTENGGDKIPFTFRIQKVIDALRDGVTFTRYYHVKEIPEKLANRLIAKLRKKGKLGYKEGGLLLEYERSKLYKRYNKIGSRILNVASGMDGLPQSIFGKENVTMLSRESDRYFRPYDQYTHGIQRSPKVDADMHKIPFENKSFSTVLFNGIQDFDAGLLSEASRVLKSGGYFIMTARGINGVGVNFEKKVEQFGFRLRENNTGVLLRSIVLEKL
jgi:SAM-dependent methyltransferase